MPIRLNVHQPNVRSANFLSTKCLSNKCPSAICPFGQMSGHVFFCSGLLVENFSLLSKCFKKWKAGCSMVGWVMLNEAELLSPIRSTSEALFVQRFVEHYHLRLSCRIHFSSHVTKRSENGQFLLRQRRKEQIQNWYLLAFRSIRVEVICAAASLILKA